MTQRPLGAAVWMLGTIVSFSVMAVAGRTARLELSTFDLMLYRSLVGFVIVVTVGGLAGTLSQVALRRFKTHLLRNACHFAGQNLWFFAISAIPLAQVFALEFTAPLWVALAAPFLLNEPMTARRALATALGFVGILIVARPDTANLAPGILAAAAAAICFAATAIATKRLTRDVTITGILFWLTLMQLVFGVIASVLYDGRIPWPSAATWPPLILIGCAGLMAHFCLTRALSVASATIVMPMDFARLPVIAIVGMLLYDEPLLMSVFLGAALIFAANIINLRPETRRSRHA